MKELKMVALEGIWCVIHQEDGAPDTEIAELFEGETCIPTPFLETVPAWKVAQELARLNPGKRILYNARMANVSY